MKLADIPQFVDYLCRYEVDVGWHFFDSFLAGLGVVVERCPEFQRGHVWTKKQQIAYIEYVLRGGRCSKEIIFACEGFSSGMDLTPMYLVDGLQRVTAVQKFADNKLKAFGLTVNEYEDAGRIRGANFSFHVRIVDTDLAGALQLYLDLNAGGTPHAASEIKRVRAILRKAQRNEP